MCFRSNIREEKFPNTPIFVQMLTSQLIQHNWVAIESTNCLHKKESGIWTAMSFLIKWVSNSGRHTHWPKSHLLHHNCSRWKAYWKLIGNHAHSWEYWQLLSIAPPSCRILPSQLDAAKHHNYIIAWQNNQDVITCKRLSNRVNFPSCYLSPKLTSALPLQAV